MTLNSDLWDWLKAQAGAKRVKNVYVIPGDSAPHWHYEQGWTKWKNGVPKHYTRSVSELTVGRDWLAEMFPVQYVTMRMAGHDDLQVLENEIKVAEQTKHEREELARMARECAQRTIALANQIAAARWPSLDPEEDGRLYAD